MKRIIIVIFLVLSFWSTEVHADHLLGGELYYNHIDGNQYKIELVLFADCSSGSGALPGLWSSHPVVILKNKSGANYTTYDSLTLSVEQPAGPEITPLCPSEIGNSSCSGGSLPGIRKFTYTGIYTLPTPAANLYEEWRFEFHGTQNISPGYIAGRSYLISNINQSQSGSPTILNLRAYLNRGVGENNSPRFNSLPTPFYCVNKPQIYNIGAVDTSIDALTYALVPALDNKCQTTVNYAPGYSSNSPIAVSSPIGFNQVSGQLSFTPNITQNSVVVYEVTERRGGQIIGTSMREVIFIVLNNCNNDAPVSTITGISNATINGQNITACGGAPIQASFNITDPNQNNVNVSYYNLPVGATLNIANNGSTNPTLNFNWPNPFPGTYVFYVELIDDGCPLAVRQTLAITVEVINLDNPIVKVIRPTNCVRKAVVEYSFPNITTNGPLEVIVKNSAGVTIKNFTGVTGTITDSLDPGQYSIYSQRVPPGCISGTVPFTIVDSGKFEYPPVAASPIYYCRGDVATQLVAFSSGPYSPTTLHWYSAGGSPLSGAPTPSTSTIGRFPFMVTQKYKTCESDPKIIDVYVSDPPGNTFSVPSPICQFDTILVRYTGSYADSDAVDIIWDMGTAVIVDSGSTFGEMLVTFPYPGSFVIGIDAISENQCYGNPNKRTIRVIPSTLTRLFGDTSVCQYEAMSISNTQPINPNTLYTWEVSPGGTIITQNPTNITAVFTTPGLNYFKLTAANDSCAYVNYHYVYVFPKPDIKLNIDNNSELCLGDTVIMRVDSGNSLTFVPEVFVKQDKDSSNKYYLIILDASEFTIYAEGPGGCLDTAYVSITNIKDCCNFFVPNAFTPNNDGVNDQFGVWFEGNPKNFKLQIFNRWGESIFQTLNKYDQWDGKYNGKDVDMGVYFYMLQGECYENDRVIEKTGDVTLLK